MDHLSPERRSRNMAAIKATGTAPEMTVRRLVHSMGYRYRLHRRDLPGKPDLVFGPRQKAIFVHGCFWHGHDCKRGGRIPGSRQDYWGPKLMRNIERDARHIAALHDLGWQVLVVWECEVKDADALENRLRDFLDTPGRPVTN